MAGARHVDPKRKDKFFKLLSQGWAINQAAEECGFSARSGARFVAERQLTITRDEDTVLPGDESFNPKKERANLRVPNRALAKAELSPIALDCLNDFGRFRARYFGRISSPWQEVAAEKVASELSTLEKSYIVMNEPPGTGKSTTFTHDIPAWLTARNRSLRGFIGSSTFTIGKSYTGRLRNTLERTFPEEADEEALRLGLGMDAETTMALDYGRFRPLPSPDEAAPPWAIDRFTVVQHGETPVGDKETTWSAWGWDSAFIGWRVNFIVWDDLVTPDNAVMDVDNRDKMRKKWRNTAERRLEPGGVLLLQGQRLGPEDLYRYCIDTEVPDFDEYNVIDLGQEELPYRKKYIHVVFPAHVEENCKAATSPEMHLRNAPAYDPRNPEASGCLLDPLRLTWRELLETQTTDPQTYATVYQQRDTDPSSVLIPEIWIEGGEDENGTYPGCWDVNRGPGELPLIPPNATAYRAISVDPSPANFWSIQEWLYVEAESDQAGMGVRYLIDEVHARMRAPDFLDWDVKHKGYVGLLTQWYERSINQSLPLHYLIFEKNAAQKFCLQYSWFMEYLFQRNIQLMGHVTHLNKGDPKLGIDTLRPHYMFGRKRFPGTPAGKRTVAMHVYELCHHPDVATEDTVMADWFFEFHRPQFREITGGLQDLYANQMPDWMKG